MRHGEVTGGAGDKKLWTGRVRCLTGYSLVGSNLLKCRDGQWSGHIPVCVKLGQFLSISPAPYMLQSRDLYYYYSKIVGPGYAVRYRDTMLSLWNVFWGAGYVFL